MKATEEMSLREMVEFFASTLPVERRTAFLAKVEEIEKEKAGTYEKNPA